MHERPEDSGEVYDGMKAHFQNQGKTMEQMMKEIGSAAEATPRPWRVNLQHKTVEDGRHTIVGAIHATDEHLRLITHAVNAHDELVEAAEEALVMFGDISRFVPDEAFEEGWGNVNHIRSTLRAALAKARGEDEA